MKRLGDQFSRNFLKILNVKFSFQFQFRYNRNLCTPPKDGKHNFTCKYRMSQWLCTVFDNESAGESITDEEKRTKMINDLGKKGTIYCLPTWGLPDYILEFICDCGAAKVAIFGSSGKDKVGVDIKLRNAPLPMGYHNGHRRQWYIRDKPFSSWQGTTIYHHAQSEAAIEGVNHHPSKKNLQRKQTMAQTNVALENQRIFNPFHWRHRINKQTWTYRDICTENETTGLRNTIFDLAH